MHWNLRADFPTRKCMGFLHFGQAGGWEFLGIDAHAGSGASTTELTVTECCRGRGGDQASLMPFSRVSIQIRPLRNSDSATRGQNRPAPVVRPETNSWRSELGGSAVASLCHR